MTSHQERECLALDFDLSSSPSQVVLQRRHFFYTLGSGRKRIGKRSVSSEEPQKTESDSEKMPINNKDDQLIKPESSNLEEPTYCTDAQYLFKLPRKNRMRDQFGHIVPSKCRAKSPTSITRLPSLKWNVMERFNRVTINIRSLKLGKLNLNFRGSVTFSVDYIEISDKVRIATSELMSCDWRTEHRLPALFLKTTAAEHHRLKSCFSMSTSSGVLCSCRSQEEKYLVINFESEPTLLEKKTLDEIFAEIGRLNNINNFVTMLSVEEVDEQLIAYKPLDEEESVMETPSVLDSEDKDAIGCPSAKIEPVRELVVYPPPPAKGGFSITEEDLGCLDEGEFLNDIIVDFYLKYLVCERLQKEVADRCHIFSSFFYKSLTNEKHVDTPGLFIQERRHNRVKTWTRHLDLFEKDFIFVPINQSAHWYLAIICFPGQVSQCSAMDASESENMVYIPVPSLPNPMSLFYRRNTSNQLFRWSASIDDDLQDEIQYDGTTTGIVFNIASKKPCILIMDSLSSCSKPAVVKILQEYLEMEWWVKRGSWQSFTKGAMNGWTLQVPKQDNHTDCGLYLLHYVESFILNPPQMLHPAVDLSDWFPQKVVKKKRERIKKLIFRLHQQQQVV